MGENLSDGVWQEIVRKRAERVHTCAQERIQEKRKKKGKKKEKKSEAKCRLPGRGQHGQPWP